MKVYISKHGNQVFLSDRTMYKDHKNGAMLAIGFPRFQFNLSEAERAENSILQLLEKFGINEDGNYGMELRRWPE